MIIQTHNSCYEVIRPESSDHTKDVYLCRRLQEDRDRSYTVICMKDIGVSQSLIEYFTNEVDTEKTTDFIEYFTYEGKLTFVFLYSRYITVEKKLLKDSCSFEERLVIGKNIMERMLYLHMPLALQADALDKNHITVSESLDIRFNYELSITDRLHDYTVQDIGRLLADIYQIIYSNEIRNNSCQELNGYLQWLKDGEYESYLDMFYRFHALYQLLKEKKPEELEQPHTRLFIIWERLKKLICKLKKLLIALLMLGAVLYLVYSVTELVKPKSWNPAGANAYRYIGTLEIKDTEAIKEQME